MVSGEGPDLESTVFNSNTLKRPLLSNMGSARHDQSFEVEITIDRQYLQTCPRTIGASAVRFSLRLGTHRMKITNNISCWREQEGPHVRL